MKNRLLWAAIAITLVACHSPALETTSLPSGSAGAANYQPSIPDSPLPGLDLTKPIPEVLRRAYDAAGGSYIARTHHKNPDGSPKFINRLMLESSPYLLQHAHNPVSWYSWGPEAFERAEKEDKLVLLSVGYSTCHWCHVMERESFEDEEIAAYINQHFVAIKVDREERPDVDKIYMSAVQMMTGRGGWPMTVLMTFDKLPVFAGTYFPPRDGARGSRKGFLSILSEYKERYGSNPQDLILNGQEIAAKVVRRARPAGAGSVPNEQAVFAAVKSLRDGFDAVHGGFGRAPKFPRSSNLELLSRHYRRSGDRQSLKMLETTLMKMAAGGMYDQVGGGFHRYSTDAKWLVPHFEKMLYDNAQLVVAYLEAFQVTGKGEYSRVAREILDYVIREMTHEQGAFFSATDADSPAPSGHDEEGLFFTWTPAELRGVLGTGDSSILIERFYGVTRRGNFEGRSILNVTQPLDVIARALDIKQADAERLLGEAKSKLYNKRLERTPPILDDKVLTSWNGLMISAFAKGGFVLGEQRYIEAAERAAGFLMKALWDGTALKRTWRKGATKYSAYLDDYAFLTAGLLDLYECTGQVVWLEHALAVQNALDEHFWDGGAGGYFFVSEQHEALLAREKPDYDGAVPAGNSIAALNLQRLALLTGDDVYRNRAEALLKGFGSALRRYGRGLPKLLTALDFYLDEPLQVVLVSPGDASDSDELVRPLREIFVPNRVVVRVREHELPKLAEKMPPIRGKRCKAGKPTAYVCRGPICTKPMTSPSELKRELRLSTPYASDG